MSKWRNGEEWIGNNGNKEKEKGEAKKKEKEERGCNGECKGMNNKANKKKGILKLREV